MGNMVDEFWNESVEAMIDRMSRQVDIGSPYEHLYEWLKEKDPVLFKQWEAVYDIMKGY
jgi:hypothetical protein